MRWRTCDSVGYGPDCQHGTGAAGKRKPPAVKRRGILMDRGKRLSGRRP